MKKRTKTLILCITIAVVTLASGLGLWYLFLAKAPVGNGNVLNVEWYNENGTEFTISTADQLFELAQLSEHYDFKGQTIKLDADIVVNEGNSADWEKELPERRWEPIVGFAGTFDGQGHTISGLYGLGHFYGIVGTKTVYYTTGMFADTQDDCVIKNFKLVNSFFSSDLNEGVGSISSYGGGTFDSIYSDATIVSYKENNGGIVGKVNKKSTITNCWFDGEIRVEGNVGRFTGGIVGRVCASNGQNKIEHCLNTANISSTVTNRGMNTGGLIGNIESQARINIEDCLTVGDIIVNYESAVGSFVGNIQSSSAVIIKNTYVKAEAFTDVIYNANGSMKGAAAALNESTLTGFNAYKWSELDFENYWAVVEDGTPILKIFAKEVPSLKGIEKGYDISWYKAADGEYLIKNAKQLYGLGILSYSTDFSGKTIYLDGDIVLNEGKAEEWAKKEPENKWIPIGTNGYPFEGSFDGQGHTISGLYMDTCGGFGLFGETGSSSLISNLRLENSYLQAFGASIGSVTGRSAGIMQNVYSNAIVTGKKGNVGGLVGQVVKNKGLQMSNCWFDGTVTNLGNSSSTKKIGGLIGAVRSESAITNCLNTGKVDASVFNYNQGKDPKNPVVVPIVGGLVGYVEPKIPLGIKDSLNVGKVLYNKAATAAYASVVGYVDGDVTAYNVYATEESCENHPLKQSVSGQVCPIATKNLTGYKAYQWTLLDFEKNWAVNKNGTPILKAFAEEVPSITGVKKEVDVSWYSTDKKTFVLDSRQDLFGFRLMSYNTDFAGKTVKLGKNITVNTGNAASWAKNAPKYQWTPIGTEKYSFKGTFDGGMRSISGLYLKTDTKYSGFFGLLKEGTAVKNLKILNSYYESSADCLGSIVGSGNANLSNLYSNAILVSSANSAGGFIGRSTKNITITNCWFDGKVTITGTGMPNRRAGGIVANIYSGKVTLSHCLNTGAVSAPNYSGTNSATSTAVVPLIGGLVGQVSKEAVATITDSLNTGKITCNPAATTGFSAIVGYSDGEVKISDTFATKESCDYQLRGKSTGYIDTYEEADISGYLGYQWLSLDFNKYWAVVVSPTASTPILKSFASKVPSVAGVDKMIDTSWYNANKKEFVLYDKADLNGFAYLSNSNDFAGKTIKLGADINMNADMKNPTIKWDPIGNKSKAFAGTFDGQMHKLTGIYVNTDVEGVGLFARTDKKATVKNLILQDSYFESTAMNVGSIAGIGGGTFDTIKSEAVVVGHNARVGGLIGMNSSKGTSLTNCWFAGTVTNKGNGEGLRGTGGLVGVSYTDSGLTIKDCLNSGTVDASAYAYNQSKDPGTVNVTVLAGGLVGWFRSGGNLLIEDSLNVGEVIVRTEQPNAANNAYGSIIGYTDGETEVSGTYTTEESSPRQKPGDKTGITVVKKNDIIGIKGYQWNKIDLDFKKIWTLVEDDTPILQSFAEKVIDITKIEKLIDTKWYDGVAGSTYTLSDKADLYGFAELSKTHNFAGMTIKLAKDIVVNEGNAADWATKAPDHTWASIGSSTLPFAGTFDGDMHSISGIYYKTTARYGGFFAATQNATISNLKITNSYFQSTVTGQADFAGLVGYARKTTFDTIYSDAIVVGAGQRTAGLVAQFASASTMTNCWFDGNVTNTLANDARTGGLVGSVTDATANTITNCLNSGTVNASKANNTQIRVGGLVGHVGSTAKLTLENSLNVGVVKYNTATGLYGSIIGATASGATVKNTYATSASCAKTGVTQTASAIATIQGENAKTNLKGFDFDVTWTAIGGHTPLLTSFVNLMIDTSWYYANTNADTFVLSDAKDLYGFASLSQTISFADKTIKLGKDITVNTGDASTWGTNPLSRVWIPIGNSTVPFAGTFNGQGYTISGLYLSTSGAGGLFGYTAAKANVMNVNLLNSYFNSTSTGAMSNIGSIAGVAKGTFQKIYSKATVVGNKQAVGGLLGQANNFTMTNCWFDGSVTGTNTSDCRMGGLVGAVTGGTYSTNKIYNCLNTAPVNASNATSATIRTGGLVGLVASSYSLTLENSLNTGTVTVNKATATYDGLIGQATNANMKVKNCYATKESCSDFGTKTKGGTAVERAAILGTAAKSVLEKFDFNTAWAIRENDTPVLIMKQ